MTASREAPVAVVLGGFGGLVGRSLLPELSARFRLRSVHRHPVASEAHAAVDWIPADIAAVANWGPILDGASVVVNLAWHRWGSERQFRHLSEGVERAIDAARAMDLPRFLHVSVPPAPASLEESLPYLYYKRRLDEVLSQTGLSYRILRPTMLFGPGDRLLGVMLRLMRRYPLFPMFGDGEYHVSPIAATDVARAIALEAEGPRTGRVDLGGPKRWRYRDLTDAMFASLGKRARYLRLSPRVSIALGQLVQDVGSTVLYAYEVEWLLSDRLGLAPYEGLDRPLAALEPYLSAEAARVRG